MSREFFKFPSTPHLARLDSTDIRDDKIFSKAEREDFLSHIIIAEEKIDGANLGISFDESGNLFLQNRGDYLIEPFNGQWKKLAGWLASRTNRLFDHLTDHYILFGEWCYAQHSITYTRLPDWFLGFDIFDKQYQKFLSANRRNALLGQMGIHQVPNLGRGIYALPELETLFGGSLFGDEPVEGIYLRWDDGDWLGKRAKLVQPHFIQAIEEHWSRRSIRANQRILEAL